MPRDNNSPNVPNESTSQTADVSAILAAAQSATVPAAPTGLPAHATGPQDKQQGGAFMGSDGRMLYKYEIDGETVILPKPLDKMEEQDFYNLPITLADLAPGRLPQNLTVTFRDPQWGGHWFNRKAREGQRVNEARSLGFIPANRDDCEMVSSNLNDEDGAIMDGDLVLMKIHKAKLFRKYAQWMEMAKVLGGKASYMNKAESQIGGAGDGKVGYFFTPQSNEPSGVGPVTHIPTIS
jgi:hypothetical protein